MKKIFSCLLIVIFGISVSGQQLINQVNIDKSKSQHSTGKFLVYGGSALAVGGIISYASESSSSFYPGKTVGTVLLIAGAAAITGGIILMSESKKNNQKTNDNGVLLNMKLENAQLYQFRKGVTKNYPALSLRYQIK